jgi:hypothetical protein
VMLLQIGLLYVTAAVIHFLNCWDVFYLPAEMILFLNCSSLYYVVAAVIVSRNIVEYIT